MRLRKWMAAAALLGAAAGTPRDAPGAPAPPPGPDPVLLRAQRTVQSGPRVLALYYGWYGTPQVSKRWLHYENVDPRGRKIGSQPHYPASGPYDSTDPAVLQNHVAAAKSAGIDTLVCSWWGQNDQTDRSFRAMLAKAEAQKLTLCPLYERVPRPGDSRAVQEDWRYLLAHYGKSPAWLKVGGKPVLFVYSRARQSLTPEQWAEVLESFEKTHAPGVTAIVDGQGLEDALVFDGLAQLGAGPILRQVDEAGVPQAFRTAFGPLLTRARRYRRIATVTVTPTASDNEEPTQKPARPAADGGVASARAEGSAYRAQWLEALREREAWVLIDSFNQWHAGTQIEPSVELGNRYLKLTTELVSRHRATVLRKSE